MDDTRSSWIRRSSVRERNGVRLGDSGRWWPTARALTSKNALAALLSVSLTGCPSGSALDTPYEQYIPESAEVVPGTGTSSVTSSTTSGTMPCDDTNVNEGGLSYWCGGCHGSVGKDNGTAPLWLFSPTRSTDFLNRPAVTDGCSAELIVDTANPEASLLFTALRGTSPCGVEMPDNLVIEIPEHQVCIEEWALGLAIAGGGG